MIQGFSELLLTRDDLGPERSRDALEQVHASSQRLGRLIDDLLSVSRIESGKLTVELGPVDIAAVIGEVVASFESQTGRRLVLELDPSLAPALGDRGKLVQVMTNLASNAVKYSPESEGANYKILEAKEGREALEVARAHHPELVLLDVMLPDLSGIEICRELKSDPLMASTTIIMLTAKAQQTDLDEAEAAGADGYFTKPFSPIALTQKVEAILGSES
jgi:CheY-like chemotaxis protein